MNKSYGKERKCLPCDVIEDETQALFDCPTYCHIRKTLEEAVQSEPFLSELGLNDSVTNTLKRKIFTDQQEDFLFVANFTRKILKEAKSIYNSADVKTWASNSFLCMLFRFRLYFINSIPTVGFPCIYMHFDLLSYILFLGFSNIRYSPFTCFSQSII